MQFKNLSNIEIPKKLWRELAATMQLHKILPNAVEDDVLIYSHKTLRVTLNRSVEQAYPNEEVILGSYACGHIALFPCSRCTLGFLTFTYLHEICHAWLDQYHEELYDEWYACDLCEKFANASFETLGGVISDRYCWTHELSIDNALENISKFKELMGTLWCLDSTDIKSWTLTKE